jgi:hypothetical protein
MGCGLLIRNSARVRGDTRGTRAHASKAAPQAGPRQHRVAAARARLPHFRTTGRSAVAQTSSVALMRDAHTGSAAMRFMALAKRSATSGRVSTEFMVIMMVSASCSSPTKTPPCKPGVS